MANPQFILGGNLLTFPRPPRYPVRMPRERIQAVDRTAGGALQVESLGGAIVRRPCTWANLSAAFIASLQNWFDVIANGAANAFTYIDEDEVSYSVRWVNNFDFEEEKSGFGGTIELEIIS